MGGGGYWYASGHSIPFLRESEKGVQKAPAKDASPSAVLQLHSFVVNLNDQDQNAFLQVSIALALDKPLPRASENGKESPCVPEVRDAILSVLSTWKSGDLLAIGGKKKLKKQLLGVLQHEVPELGVVDIYFTDFLVQQ